MIMHAIIIQGRSNQFESDQVQNNRAKNFGVMNINDLIKARIAARSSYQSAACEINTHSWGDKALWAKTETDCECNQAIHDHEKRCPFVISFRDLKGTPIDGEY